MTKKVQSESEFKKSFRHSGHDVMIVISVLGTLGQEDSYFEDSLKYRVSSKASWATVWDPVSKREEKDYQKGSVTTVVRCKPACLLESRSIHKNSMVVNASTFAYHAMHAPKYIHCMHACTRMHTHTYILTLIINEKEGRNQRRGEEREEAFQIVSMILLCNIGGKALLWSNFSEIIAVEAMKDYWFVSWFLMHSTNCIIMLKIIRPTSYQILVKELH